MSISVLVAIAGVMVAAVGTGLLGGRCIRSPRPSFIAWSIGMFALTVALLAQSIGFEAGFGPVTFRVIQLSAQLVAPVVLAWGLVELIARGPAARFGARLAAAALVIVIGVILATDPLAVKPFGTAWPSAAVHYQLIPHYALIALHLAVVMAAITAVVLCAARGRGEPAPGQLVPGAVAVGAATACTVALRFTLPADAAYPALSALSAGLVWFGMTRLDGVMPAVSRAGTSGTRGRDFPGRNRTSSRAGGAHGAGAASGSRAASGYGAAGGYGVAGPEADFPDGELDRSGFPAGGFGRSGSSAGELGGPGLSAGGFGGPGFSAAGFPGAAPPGTERRGGDARPLYPPGAPGAEPATGAAGRPGAAPGAGEPRPGVPGTEIVRPAPRPHGLIAIYTLLEDRVADFDRIAEEAAEQVRAHEPDTLVYVIHIVPKAPMQRIFYEIYRDRAAYERHEQQPYIKRFVTARRPYVLATNVIELRLKYAKIAPLVQDETQAQSVAETLAQAGVPAPDPGRAPTRAGRPQVQGSGRAQAQGNGRGPADPRAVGDPRALGDPRAPRDPRALGDPHAPRDPRAGGDPRIPGPGRGREHLPPPVPPPRRYGGV
jgi:quinol monooxygenase YgiN